VKLSFDRLLNEGANLRPLEVLLTIANLLAFCALAIPWLAQMRRIRYAVLLVLAIGATQALAEGVRWQMVPAYVLALALSGVSALRIIVPPRKKMGQNPVKRLVIGGSICIGILLCTASLVLPTLLPVFQLPTPSGPYQIGTVKYHWTDTSRQEIFSTNPTDRRQLMAQVWYPVKGDLSSARAPYVDDAGAMSVGVTQALSSSGLVKLPSFFFDHFAYVRTHAIPSAPVATDKDSFPVLIYVTGLDGFRQASMFQVENLVSHGYIVVGLDQPYTAAAVTFPNGQVIKGLAKSQVQPLIDQSISPAANAPKLNGQPLTNGIIPYLAQDITFTLDQLAALNSSDPNAILNGHLDLRHVGVFGVSLGAMVAGEACREDLRLGACLMMDAAMPADVVRSGLQQPGMWLTRPASDMRLERARSGGWSEKAIQQTLSSMQAVYAKAKPGGSYDISIPGMFHLNFTDAPYYSPFASRLGLAGPIGGQRGFDIVNAYSLAFFDSSLKDQQSPLLAGLSKQYQEVNIGTH
jgi:predicted dienelactone hydrolase